jgi:predicted TIM-barrel fold metal-dependent hydrolase
VDFVIPHLGSFADDWRAQVALIDHLVRHPNIYTDTAGVRRFDILAQAVERAGARKILFGSDGPWLHPGTELAKVRALRLTQRDEALVLGRNFLRLIERAGSPRRAGIEQELGRFVPVRRSAAQMMDRGDPWLREGVFCGQSAN